MRRRSISRDAQAVGDIGGRRAPKHWPVATHWPRPAQTHRHLNTMDSTKTRGAWPDHTSPVASHDRVAARLHCDDTTALGQLGGHDAAVFLDRPCVQPRAGRGVHHPRRHGCIARPAMLENSVRRNMYWICLPARPACLQSTPNPETFANQDANTRTHNLCPTTPTLECLGYIPDLLFELCHVSTQLRTESLPPEDLQAQRSPRAQPLSYTTQRRHRSLAVSKHAKVEGPASSRQSREGESHWCCWAH